MAMNTYVHILNGLSGLGRPDDFKTGRAKVAVLSGYCSRAATSLLRRITRDSR
jgi:hypothetical protein